MCHNSLELNVLTIRLQINRPMDQKEQEILKLLEVDVKAFREALKETTSDIVAQGFSKFPILIAHEAEITIADKIIDKDVFSSQFNFSATTLEALVDHGVIPQDKRSSFEHQMKQSKDAVCILLIHPEVMKFVFSPL